MYLICRSLSLSLPLLIVGVILDRIQRLKYAKEAAEAEIASYRAAMQDKFDSDVNSVQDLWCSLTAGQDLLPDSVSSVVSGVGELCGGLTAV